MTHYDILGIDRTAKDTEIKKAYHQMLIAFHPDKYQGDKQFAAKKTHELIEAYNMLRLPATRQEYDDFLNAQLHNTTERLHKDTYYQNTKPKGMNKYKMVLGVIGLLFIVFVVVLFTLILISI